MILAPVHNTSSSLVELINSIHASHFFKKNIVYQIIKNMQVMMYGMFVKCHTLHLDYTFHAKYQPY